MIYSDYSLFPFTLFLIASFLGLFFLSSLLHVSFRKKNNLSLYFQGSSGPLFSRFYKTLFRDDSYKSLLFIVTIAKYTLFIFCITSTFLAFLGPLPLVQYLSSYAWMNWLEVLKLCGITLFLIAIVTLIMELIPRTWAYYSHDTLLKVATPFGKLFIIILSPILFFISSLTKLAWPHGSYISLYEQKENVFELFQDQNSTLPTDHELRLIQSIASYRNRIAREIMKPRVDLFCLSENTPIQTAAELLEQEGYSRVPVFHETIDSVIGILYYRDLLAFYIDTIEKQENLQALLESPIKSLLKKPYFCPETKKISSLLQEMRKHKTHLAVVVDEYGGTAGLVTIEDILEELVGEIADEYDDTELMYTKEHDGWLIDARMNLLDVEEELGVKIPQEGDYDTLAGYVFYCIGSIPEPGLVLHHDDFELEIVKSNDRMVEKVRLKTLPAKSL